MKNYISIHNHSSYSMLDALANPEQLVLKAKSLNMKGLAITDHGNMNCYPYLYKFCKQEGIKPILGCEFYMIKDLKKWKEEKEVLDKDENLLVKDRKLKVKEISKRYHLIVLAKNLIGFKNLCKLIYESSLNFYYRPRIDRNMLDKYRDGLIVSAACIAGEIQQSIILNESDKKKNDIIDFYKSVFKDDYYFELQFNELSDQEKANQELLVLGKKLKIKSIITTDTHYLDRDDQSTHQSLLLMNSKATYQDLRNKQEGIEGAGSVWEFNTKELYFKSYKELDKSRKDFSKCDLKQFENLCDNTYDIFEKIEDYELDTSVKLKDMNPEIKNKNKYIYEICLKELNKKKKNDKVYSDRLKYEMGIIKQKNFENYFLSVKRIIDLAKETGMLVGCGRGSGAGSLVNYLLGITQVDPIKYNLLFERFLSIDRCLEEDMFVVTDSGMKKIKELTKIDKLEVLNGNFVNIKKISERVVDKIYRIKFDNDFVECSEEHKFLIERDGKRMVVMAKELKKTDFLFCEKYCKCGCGKKILIKLSHKYYGIPNYLHGHNFNEKKTREKSIKAVLISNQNSARNKKIRKNTIKRWKDDDGTWKNNIKIANLKKDRIDKIRDYTIKKIRKSGQWYMYDEIACKKFDEINRKYKLDFVHALNGKEKRCRYYSLDGYSERLKLNIEIDGQSHKNNIIKDEGRDKFIKSLGINVLRIKKCDLGNFDFDKYFGDNYGIQIGN